MCIPRAHKEMANCWRGWQGAKGHQDMGGSFGKELLVNWAVWVLRKTQIASCQVIHRWSPKDS